MLINKALFQVNRNFSSVTNMQQQMEKLQVQLATGKNANRLSELGGQTIYDLSLRSRLDRIESFKGNIDTVQFRITAMSNVMERLDSIESEARKAVNPSAGAQGAAIATSQSLSKARLDEVLTLLQSDLNGRYLFGGSASDQKPVENLNTVLDGVNGRAGFRTVANERRQADMGPDGKGRVAVTQPATDTVSLSEDGTHPFGIKLSTLSTDSANIALTAPTGAPSSLSVQFTGTVQAGEKVTIGVTLPDGSSASIALTATNNTPPGQGQFLIGGNPNADSSNFAAALNTELVRFGDTSLRAASMYAAADNFFSGQGETPMRVDGPPYDTATALIAGTSANTVFWYKGEDTGGNPRETVQARVDDAQKVNYGVQANENGIVGLVRALAAMAVQNYPDGDANNSERFAAMSRGQLDRLSEQNNGQAGSIEVITLELGIASAASGQAAERHIDYGAQLDEMLADIEQAPIEEVAMRLLSLQTRLEASYQTISSISRLTLVNFIN